MNVPHGKCSVCGSEYYGWALLMTGHNTCCGEPLIIRYPSKEAYNKAMKEVLEGGYKKCQK